MKIVIKVGTSTLVNKDGTVNEKFLAGLAQSVNGLRTECHDVVIVSSGAIGAAAGYLKLRTKPKTLREKQALAAVGQPLVMSAYAKAFSKYGCMIAQVLLTRDDFDNRTKYINARNTLSQLIDDKIIAVVNENDTVAVEEINFGDNDTLGALVAAAVDADVLIIFTDVDGLYEGHPSKGLLIRNVDKITEEIESYATSKSASGKGTGGMKTKILAARIATASGVETIIANGSRPGKIKDIIERKEVCTVFSAKSCQMEAKKSWIAFSKKPKGNIFVDKKASEALVSKGKSLLAAGVTKVSGNFKRGDTVVVTESETKKDFARGLVNFDIADMHKIKGKKTADIKKIIENAEEEVIHRNNLVIL